MYKKNKITMLLAALSLVLFSCDYYSDQEVASPTVFEQGTIQDTTFVAAATSAGIVLTEAAAADSSQVLTVSAIMNQVNPNAVVKYILQISSNRNFTDTAVLNCRFDGKVGSKVKVRNSELNIAVDKLTGSLVQVPVYARLIAQIDNGGAVIKQVSVADASKAVATFNVTPYSMLKEFSEYTPKTWYLVGLGGNWNNSMDGLGSSLIPMSVVSGKEYDSNGNGKFVYTGYFSASTSFKLIHTPGDWNTQWANKSVEGIDNPVMNDGGSSNFKVPTDGYYTITLNSIKNTISIVAASVNPTSYTSIGLIGEFSSWSDRALTSNPNTGNHTWYTTVTIAADGKGKFRANGAWTINWGNDAKTFPIGFGAQDKADIPFKAGTYTVLFNDIDGCYWFVAR